MEIHFVLSSKEILQNQMSDCLFEIIMIKIIKHGQVVNTKV